MGHNEEQMTPQGNSMRPGSQNYQFSISADRKTCASGAYRPLLARVNLVIATLN